MHMDERYSRQVLFKEIGAEGQKKLSRSRVVIVGCGATGSALASLLARSGGGTLRILDLAYVESSNLQRQQRCYTLCPGHVSGRLGWRHAADSRPRLRRTQQIAAAGFVRPK